MPFEARREAFLGERAHCGDIQRWHGSHGQAQERCRGNAIALGDRGVLASRQQDSVWLWLLGCELEQAAFLCLCQVALALFVFVRLVLSPILRLRMTWTDAHR